MQNLKISSGSMSKFFEIYKPLKIENPNGDIFRVLRNDEKSFDGLVRPIFHPSIKTLSKPGR